jgi:hypothetical protein
LVPQHLPVQVRRRLVRIFRQALARCLFLAAYALYVWRELRADGDLHEAHALEPLKFRPHDRDPSLLWAILQTGVALILVFAASRIFVSELGIIGPALGIPAQLVALLANISGAMMIQATIPTAFGLVYPPWLFDPSVVLAGGVTIIATALLFFMFRRARLLGKSSRHRANSTCFSQEPFLSAERNHSKTTKITAMHIGISLSLLSAALFNASTLLAKILMGSVSPWLMAGLLYPIRFGAMRRLGMRPTHGYQRVPTSRSTAKIEDLLRVNLEEDKLLRVEHPHSHMSLKHGVRGKARELRSAITIPLMVASLSAYKWPERAGPCSGQVRIRLYANRATHARPCGPLLMQERGSWQSSV